MLATTARLSLGSFLIVALIFAAQGQANADPTGHNGPPATAAANNPSTSADVFDAMHAGDLGVQFIPRNSREATLILTNNTDQPLNVHLPDAFAAIPVAAQFPGFNQLPNNNNQANNRFPANNNPKNSNNKNPNQTLGTGTSPNTRPTGFGAANGRQGAQQNVAQFGNGFPGAAFDIPPERVVKIKLPVVCLEYRKQEPTAHVPYTIEPIADYTKSPEVQELCRQLGTGKIDQRAAQAAAWHLANHMSWEQLTNLKSLAHNKGFSRSIFTKDQIAAAKELTEKAIKSAAARADSPDQTPEQSNSAQGNASPGTIAKSR